MSDDRTPSLAARADALDAAVDLARGRLADDVVDAAAQTAAAVRARLRHGTDRTVVALAGPTGSGKSSLFNALAGDDVSTVGVRRPTTGVPHAACWGGDAPRLLHWLEVPRRHLVTAAPDGTAPDARLDGLVLVDLPDIDSVEVSNRLESDRLIGVVDAMVWVLDPQKYADDAVHNRALAPLAPHAAVLRVVLSKRDLIPAGERDAVVDDLRRRLGDIGLGSVPVWTATVPPSGDPTAPTTGLATRPTTGLATGDTIGTASLGEVRDGLADLVTQRRATVDRLDADLRVAATPFIASTPPGGPDTSAAALDGAGVDDAFVDDLAAAAQAGALVDAVAEQHRRDARHATGWPPIEWIRARRPSAVTTVRAASGDRVDPVAVETSLRDLAERAGATLGAPWDTTVRRELLGRAPDLTAALASRSLGAARAAGSPPRWWSLVRAVQLAAVATAAVGLVWLVALAALGTLRLDTAPLEADLGWGPLPTLLFLGGVLAGSLIALAARVPIAVAARRRGRRARRMIRTEVAGIAEREAAAPLAAVLADRAELARLSRFAAGDR